MKRPVVYLLVALLLLLTVHGAVANQIAFYDIHNQNLGAPAATSGTGKLIIIFNQSVNITSLIRYAGVTATSGKIVDGVDVNNGVCTNTELGTCTFDGSGFCNFTTPVQFLGNTNYTICVGSGGSSYNYVFADFAGGTVGNTSMTNWRWGWFNAGGPADGRILNLGGIRFNITTPSSSPINTITVTLSNLVNGSGWPSTVTFSNKTGTLNFSYFNITNAGFCVTVTGNGTSTNCTTSGSGASTYFNVSNNSVVVTGSQSVSAGTYQALINMSAYRLFLNTSISGFNTTNGVFKNTSGSLVYALNGTNNVKIDVAGNYSKNVTCTVSAPLSTAACNATGIYDDLFTIGATNASSSTSILTFQVTMTNTTVGAAVLGSTTSGNVTFATLQGYWYTFLINASNFELANVTIPANASTNRYNFTLRTANTFNFTIYNETTNGLITENVTLQIISGDYAANFTFSGGSKVIELLTPGDYSITYWVDPDVPRDYYYTLTSQSYNSIKLYIVDESISNLYLPIVINSNTVPVVNVTVQLLRDYIITGNTHAYSIVEMAKTDTNGQAVLRVVPNIVDYKLIITDGTNTLSTQPTKFTANTNTYTFNTEGDPTTSLVGYENIAKGLSWDNSTLTYTFTWADSQNIVSSGCLKVTKFKKGVQTTDLNSCLAGTSGSIAHTINDTNGTSYNAVATLLTNTQFSTLGAGSLTVTFDSDYATFGIIGFVIAFIIFLTFVFVGGESGIAGALVSGFVAILIAGAFGFIANSWTAVVVPAAVIIGIIIYRLRS